MTSPSTTAARTRAIEQLKRAKLTQLLEIAAAALDVAYPPMFASASSHLEVNARLELQRTFEEVLK